MADPLGGLKSAGRRLWEDVLGSVGEFDQREEAMMLLACRQADDVATLEALLAEQGTVVAGSQGQPRLSPVIGELRQGRLAVARLVEQALAGPEETASGARSWGWLDDMRASLNSTAGDRESINAAVLDICRAGVEPPPPGHDIFAWQSRQEPPEHLNSIDRVRWTREKRRRTSDTEEADRA